MWVYKGQYGYSVLCKNKLLNGEEIKCYVPVSFQRGDEPSEEKVNIEPIEGQWWMTCYMDRNQNVKPKLYIKGWRRIEEALIQKPLVTDEIIEDTKEEEKPIEQILINGQDLPFY